GRVRKAALLLRRRRNDKRQVQAGVVLCGLGAGEWDAVVAQEDDERVLGSAGLAQRLQHQTDAVVESADRLVVVGQLLAHLRLIGQEVRYDNILGVIARFGHAAVGLLVTEPLGRAVGV